MEFKLGDFNVLDIEPMPDLPKRRLELLERPGVDGTGIWDTGLHGRPCTVRSRVDAIDLGAAMDRFADYCELIDDDPLEVIFADVPLSGYGAKYQVLDVRLVSVAAIVGASGGLHPPSQGWLECEWDLLPVPPSADCQDCDACDACDGE